MTVHFTMPTSMGRRAVGQRGGIPLSLTSNDKPNTDR
jgi:hypothetical protein